jgi:four helix bundle protein
MTQIPNNKHYDLEERTLKFAQNVSAHIRTLPRTITNIEYAKQLSRSSGSIGANYIEANEALSKKDFLMRIKICKKEAKETCYWLNLIEPSDKKLLQKSTELMKIFGAILEKSI